MKNINKQLELVLTEIQYLNLSSCNLTRSSNQEKESILEILDSGDELDDIEDIVNL